MTTDVTSQQSIDTVDIQKTVDIAAPIDIAFEAMLVELGPDAQMMDGTAMPFKLEAWPGGRWYAGSGNNGPSVMCRSSSHRICSKSRDR